MEKADSTVIKMSFAEMADVLLKYGKTNYADADLYDIKINKEDKTIEVVLVEVKVEFQEYMKMFIDKDDIRVEIPEFELVSNRTIKIDDVKNRDPKFTNEMSKAVDTLLKQQVNDPEKYKAIKSLVDNNNEVFELLYGVYENTAPKDIGKAQSTMAAKESPEETVGRILSDTQTRNDYYRTGGQNIPQHVRNQLKEAMGKANPKEIAKHIRYGQ